MEQQTRAISKDRPRLAVVGVGRLGSVLARAFSHAGYPVVACYSRTRSRAEDVARLVPGCLAAGTPSEAAGTADWVFLTVPDDAIATVDAEIAWTPHHVAVHCSGAQTAATMVTAIDAGARVAGFHPLQTFADSEIGLTNLPGSAVGIEADEGTWPSLAQLATAVGATPLRIRGEQRATYHLGSVVVSNFTVGLMGMASMLWQGIGIDEQTAVRALLPLLQGTARNLEALGVEKALTGPVVRGDAGTVARHLDALDGRTEQRAVYIAMSHVLVDLAEQGGRLTAEQGGALRQLLDRPESRQQPSASDRPSPAAGARP